MKAMKTGSKIWKILSGEREEIRRRLENEKDAKVRIRLILLNLVASGLGVGEAAALLGMKQRIAYVWINRWIKKGYEGLLPKKRSGRPPTLDKEQKKALKGILNQKEYWTTKEIQRLIKDEFGVEYKKSRLYELLKELKMKHSKPYNSGHEETTECRGNPG